MTSLSNSNSTGSIHTDNRVTVPPRGQSRGIERMFSPAVHDVMVEPRGLTQINRSMRWHFDSFRARWAVTAALPTLGFRQCRAKIIYSAVTVLSRPTSVGFSHNNSGFGFSFSLSTHFNESQFLQNYSLNAIGVGALLTDYFWYDGWRHHIWDRLYAVCTYNFQAKFCNKLPRNPWICNKLPRNLWICIVKIIE